MKILLIEDEPQAAWDLKQTLQRIRPDIEILASIDSVESGVSWMENNPLPDLIFSDIRLGDGLSFEIFEGIVNTPPIIFCTAFDDYILKAFKTNGIDYILKPLHEDEIRQSLGKYDSLKRSFQPLNDSLLQQLTHVINGNSFRKNIVVPFRNKFVPLDIHAIMVFRLEEGMTEIVTKEGVTYNINYTLEHIESTLDPSDFFRANRQTILSRDAVKEVEHYVDRKLLVHLKYSQQTVMVSKARAGQFLHWLGAR